MVPRTASPAQYQGVPVTETRDDSVTWMSQEAYDRLKAELDHLSGPGRVDIAKKIEAARDEGDLKENGGYHAAKDEQGKQEARIRQLEEILSKAEVASIISERLCGGILVAIPTAMPSEPLMSRLGSLAGSTEGCIRVPS